MTRSAVLCCGAHAIEGILKAAYRVDVAKVLDPTDADDFVVIVRRLESSLRGIDNVSRTAALRAAIHALDVDWRDMTAEAREAVVAAAREVSSRVFENVAMPRVVEEFRVVGGRTTAAARRGAIRRFGLQILTSLSERDRAAERFVRETTAVFVRDEFGRRADEMATTARDIVASGLETGLGRDEIAEALETTLSSLGRARGYWQVVAGQFVNVARTASLLHSFADAGIERYRFEAVMDEATTDVCRFFHGKIFDTASGVAAMSRVVAAAQEDPDSVYETSPWLRTGTDATGGRVIYMNRGDERVVVAHVDVSGVGTRDAVGSYRSSMTSDDLARAGVPWPPLHGNCRSTIVPA